MNVAGEFLVRVIHRSEQGDIDVDYVVSNVSEAQTIIEQGPGWKSIISISVERLNLDEVLTIQQCYADREVHHLGR